MGMEIFHKPFKNSRVLQNLFRQQAAVASLVFIFLTVVLGVFAYCIVPDKTTDANTMILELTGKPAGFHAELLAVPRGHLTHPPGWWHRFCNGTTNPYHYIPITSYSFKGDSLVIQHYLDDETTVHQSMSIASLARGGNVRYIRSPSVQSGQKSVANARALTSLIAEKVFIQKHLIVYKSFWLGTDRFGRDILSRLILGIRISLGVGFIAVFISLVIGIAIGAIAGYFGGFIDDLLVWFISVVWAVPTLLLVFALTLTLGKGFWQIFLAVGLTMWVEVARLVRGQVMSIKQLPYIEATQSLGYSSFRIIFRHILPNIVGPVLVVAANNFAAAIVIEAGLSFLGVGVQPPTPSWGLMLKENYAFIITHNPLLAIIPGIAIMMLVLAFNILGNGIRDAFDVRR